MLLWTGFLLGLLGSLHCLGMCGPLAMALPTPETAPVRYLLGRAVYNLGRVVTYSTLGLLFGWIGRTLVLAGIQQGLSLGIGFALLLAVFLGPRMAPRFASRRWIHSPVDRLKRSLVNLLGRRSVVSLLLIGVLNGLLPCGLVYVALAGAAATGNAWQGALYMAAFGAGTFPLMLAVSLLGRPLQFRLRLTFQRAVPIALTMLAMLFILRGLSLGIPYVSPDLTPAKGGVTCCH